MRKKSLLAWILVAVCCVTQNIGVMAATDNDYVGNTMSQEISTTEMVTAEISEGVRQYFSEEWDLTAIESLVLSSTDGYRLTEDDVHFLIYSFPKMKYLDVSNCIFESQSCMDECNDYFTSHPEIEYKSGIVESENDELANNTDKNIQEDFSNKNNAGLLEKGTKQTLERGSNDTKINGICLIDKIQYCEVGADYMSDDPNLEFRWLQYDVSESKWSEVTSWNKGNWATWKPNKAGDYWIYVEARNSKGEITSSVYGYHFEGIHLTLNGICMLDQGTRYDVGVAYTTNDLNVKFQWKVYDLAKKEWKLVSAWSQGNWMTWKPKRGGDYWLYVEAMDSDGNITSLVKGFTFTGLEIALNGICVVQNKTSVDMGVDYKTNDSDVKFRWKVYNLTSKEWESISDWSQGNWSTWKPKQVGDYWLYVEAKTDDGQMKSQVMGYHVEHAKIIEFNINPESPGWTDRSVCLKGAYQDVIGEVGKSRILLYDGAQWKELAQDTESVEWHPSVLGNYLFCYEIYDASGRMIEQVFKGYSVEVPYVNLNGIYVREDGNLQYSMAVSCESNDREIAYHWMIYDVSKGTWSEISDWNRLNSVTWNAKNEGAYWIHVEAKLHNGEIKTYTMGYMAQSYPADMRAMMARANSYSSSTPYLLMVNRSTHKVGIFQGWQGNWKCIQYWDCSDGAINTPTVEGVFKVGSKGYYFDSGSARCFWYTQFYRDYLFHSVLYYKNGTLMDGRLGMPLSHGCVRLNINNAKWIYDNIPVSSTVCVYH